jgi:ankyrin repeat protein
LYKGYSDRKFSVTPLSNSPTPSQIDASMMNVSLSLITAAGAGKLDDVCDLMEKGASINGVDGDGCTALMRASECGHVEIVVKLLKHETLDLNAWNKDGWTALMFASWEGFVLVVMELLKKANLDVNLHDRDGDTALILATRAGHMEIVVELLKAAGLDGNRQNKFGETAMDLAKCNGHSEIVKCFSEDVEFVSHGVGAKICDFHLEAAQLRDCDALLITAAGAGKLDDVCDPS